MVYLFAAGSLGLAFLVWKGTKRARRRRRIRRRLERCSYEIPSFEIAQCLRKVRLEAERKQETRT